MEILYAILFFLFGITLTSFFQLIGERLPEKKSITGRSECDVCKHNLRWIDIIPIFGYIINFGKCHFCDKKILIKYLLMELFGGLLFAAAYLYSGFSLNLIVALIMLSVLIVETSSDIKFSTVIDSAWMIGLVFLVIIRIIQNNFLEYLLSGSILFVTLFAISLLGKAIYKKEALGGGDVKLYFFIGFLITIWNGLLSLFLASVLALIFAVIKKKRNIYIPLVPFISIAVVITYFYGDNIIDWYLNLFGM